MVTKGDKIVFALILVFAVLTFFFLNGRNSTSGAKAEVREESGKGKKGKKKDKAKVQADPRIRIAHKWDMPADLKEISGIAYLTKGRFACVQDELGQIFIYNTGSGQIEKKIPFGDPGDYEGIAVVGKSAYVIRADGNLFEVSGYDGPKPSVIQYRTHLTAQDDVEGICYDQKHNRLLLSIKGKEAGNADFKGIYAFDLTTKTLSAAPSYKIDLTADTDGAEEKIKIQPSDLDVHPGTGDIYILDGPDSRLLVMGTNGVTMNLYQLDTREFPQPEGISFTPAGTLFISNEGAKGPGNILQVEIEAAP